MDLPKPPFSLLRNIIEFEQLASDPLPLIWKVDALIHDNAPVIFITNVTRNSSLNRPANDISNRVFGGNGQSDAIQVHVRQLDVDAD